MKTFGAGDFKVFVKMKPGRGQDEMHYFMTNASRQRFINNIRKDKAVKNFYKDPE